MFYADDVWGYKSDPTRVFHLKHWQMAQTRPFEHAVPRPSDGASAANGAEAAHNTAAAAEMDKLQNVQTSFRQKSGESRKREEMQMRATCCRLK